MNEQKTWEITMWPSPRRPCLPGTQGVFASGPRDGVVDTQERPKDKKKKKKESKEERKPNNTTTIERKLYLSGEEASRRHLGSQPGN